ncbi:uncharacterized protein EV422DRAFT_600755 [Fimicolochytrium jonesii]|uniref:uncharacterized protein n=1 Tax=Fimicolochytrium jonesii TaxID=1396493 RepID=UPI0022FEFD7C|nr:uncharacterized protein EV422DRAFT_600755 [Fimicolochytrium jonesii]KAI8825956.1 hypothetical protein EV422DRAFT_600755 [Fimicolochytrium jonesii]
MFIRLCSDRNITARTSNDTGVWVSEPKRNDEQRFAALGIKVRRRITSHGFALNCNTDLEWYEYIVPCGLPGKDVTTAEVVPHALRAVSKPFDATVAALAEVSPEFDFHIDRLLAAATT